MENRRYPGLKPFETGEQKIFYGREDDIEQLHKQIVLEKLVILYSKSGYGKSSLLNAGIIPRVRNEDKLIPYKVRFGSHIKSEEKQQNLLKNILIETIKQSDNYPKSEVPKILKKFADFPDMLWYHLKRIQFENKDTELKTPLIIFDQFEEIFSYPESDINEFAEQLASLINGAMPTEVQESVKAAMQSGEEINERQLDLLYEPIKVKVVAAIRSDRMSLLNKLKKQIPAILSNTYELSALTREQAEDAIILPAGYSKDDMMFETSPFDYSDQALDEILNYLTANNTKSVESFQLQVICQHIELNRKTIKQNVPLQAEDLPKLEIIFKSYYDNLMAKIGDKDEQHAVRKLIEDNLIIDNNRISLPEAMLLRFDNINSDILRKLVETRLLRAEPNTVGSFSYELAHDTLVHPILEAREKRILIEKQREAEEKKRKEIARIQKEKEEAEAKRAIERKRARTIIVIVSIATIISIGLSLFAFIQMKKAERASEENKQLYEKVRKEQYKTQLSNYDKYIELGNKYKENGEFSDAIEQYSRALEWIDSIQAKNLIEECNELFSIDEKFSRIIEEGKDLERRGEDSYKAAMEKYREALALDYNNKLAQTEINGLNAKMNAMATEYIRRAELFINANNKERARSLLEKALNLRPNNAEVRRLLDEL